MHCKCDPGYEGNDCASRICPQGDDPMSVTENGALQIPEVQTIVIENNAGNAALAGGFVVQYQHWRGEKWQTWELPVATFTAISLKEALQGLPNHAIPNVTVG